MTDPQHLAPQARIPHVFEEPNTIAVARVYADAYLDAVPAGQLESAVEEFRSFVDDVVKPQPEFQRLLLSGQLSAEQMTSLLEKVLGGRASDTFLNFLRVLARHGRMDLLFQILHQVFLRYEARTNQQRVEVTSARPLNEETLAKIQAGLAAALPFRPILIPRVDPTLLGGLRIRVGDTVYDTSLRSRLEQLRQRLRDRSVHEIQSGRNRFSHSA